MNGIPIWADGVILLLLCAGANAVAKGNDLGLVLIVLALVTW